MTGKIPFMRPFVFRDMEKVLVAVHNEGEFRDVAFVKSKTGNAAFGWPTAANAALV